MVFNTGAALLDAVVLAVVSKEKEGTYGYRITQDVRGVLDVSESTLYPVLRRLQKDDCLEVYDMAYAGRNRRYYKLTDRGAAQLEFYKAEWKIYASKDALDFYNSYFDDAGAENEASVLRELGSPEKVAAIIKADLKGSAGGYEYGEYTEHGYEDAPFLFLGKTFQISLRLFFDC